MPTENDLSFPINNELLDEALKLKKERALIKERIEKIEAKKNDVSSGVYEKVRQDYVAKLDEATNALLEKKTDIDRELATLYETKSKITENLNQNKEELEELKFRFELAEFSEAEFKKLSKEKTDKVNKFEKVLAAVAANAERYEEIFADEEGIADNTIPPVKKHAPVEKTPTKKEESDFVVEEGEKNYFSPTEASSETTGDVTKKTPLTGEAVVVIIEGEHTGKEYKLRKETSIGRANTNTIVLKDAKVSRQHAVIKQSGNEFVINDLNSSNGIFVNGEKVREHVLGDADIIQIGDHQMQFKVS